MLLQYDIDVQLNIYKVRRLHEMSAIFYGLWTHIENEILNNVLKLIHRQATYLEYNEPKIYQISKDICKRVVWFSVLAPRRQQPLYGQPPNEFCACALQKQLVRKSHLNICKSCEDQPIWMIFIINFCRNLWLFSIPLFDITTNLWVIYEV